MKSPRHVAKGYPWLLGGKKTLISAQLFRICQNDCDLNNPYLRKAEVEKEIIFKHFSSSLENIFHSLKIF